MTSPPKLVLDTNVLRNKDFINWLSSEYHGMVVTSPVAYMENKRQLIGNKKDPDKLDDLLTNANITVEEFGKKEANIAALFMAGREKVCPECGKIDWADTMIYASIGNPPTLLVTSNADDYPSDDRVKTPAEIKRQFSHRRRQSSYHI